MKSLLDLLVSRHPRAHDIMVRQTILLDERGHLVLYEAGDKWFVAHVRPSRDSSAQYHDEIVFTKELKSRPYTAAELGLEPHPVHGE